MYPPANPWSNSLLYSRFYNLVPRALFPGFGGGTGKAREKRPGDEVAVFSVVTQRSLVGGALRDDTKNGCIADYWGKNTLRIGWIICTSCIFIFQ